MTTLSTSLPRRKPFIDILKTLAMFMVVCYHCCFYKMDYGYTPGATEYVPNLARALMNLCSMGVPLFFMCSGYCTLASASSGWKKMGRKVLTILLLTLLWNYVTPFPIWFFISLSALYLATPILRRLKQHYPRLYWCGVACIGFATFGLNETYVISRLFAPNIMDNYHIQGLFTSYALVYYTLGDWFKSRNVPAKLALGVLVAGFALSLVDGAILTTACGNIFDGVNGAFPMLSSLLMTVGTFSLLERFKLDPQSRATKTMALIASGCLAVYIFHIFFLNTINQLLASVWNAKITQYSIPGAIVWSLLIWAISWSAGMLIRRIPYVCYLMKL